MRDRLPTPGKENRVKITQDDGTAVEGVLSYADDATQEGSPYTKGNVLPDEVCNAYDLDTVTSEPKDAFLAVPRIMGKALLSVTVYKINGTPYPGVVIGGLTNIDTPRGTTNSNGGVTLYVDAGTYNLTFTPNPVCIDTSIPNKQVTVAAGGSGTVTTTEVSNGLTSLNVTSSRTVAFSSNVYGMRVFCVGGGGAGGAGAIGTSGVTSSAKAGGGGGGYTTTANSVSFTKYQNYQLIVGSGGTASASGGSGGGTTSAFGVSALGGHPGGSGIATPTGSYGNGGNGGSGGGGGGFNGGNAGSNGEDGNSGINNSAMVLSEGGTGQGSTTRAFGESSGTLYSGGGGGGSGNLVENGGSGGGGRGAWGNSAAVAGTPNTGGGGGGGGVGSRSYIGGNGGFGIILLRWSNRT